MDPHRIASTSVTHSVSRQTPKADFGDYLSAGALAAGSWISTVVPGGSAVSAAISATSAITSVGTSNRPLTPASTTGVGEQWDLLSAQRSQSNEYLALQNEMQRESREFNALSNVLKVRHDSAKAAINNIR